MKTRCYPNKEIYMTQFSSRQGICYQWRTQNYWFGPINEKAQHIEAQYKAIIQHFRVIHTYQLCGWDLSHYTDLETPGAGTLLKLAGATNKTSPTISVEVVQGTSNGVFDKFTTEADDAANWAKTLLGGFNQDTALALKTVRAIVLGNEIDAVGMVNHDPQKLEKTLLKLYSGLKSVGLGAIPITSTFANIGSDKYTNPVAQALVQTIYNNWQAEWNSDTPFVFANHYTANMTSTDPTTATSYIENARSHYTKTLNMPKLKVYVGEMGYSAADGEQNEAKVDNAFFKWASNQEQGAPVCVFQAYDQPHAGSAREKQYGVFQTSNNQAKSGIELPALSA
ncbi:MAG: hypothetical protein AAF614_31605 [Chloroflexota bacterium]